MDKLIVYIILFGLVIAFIVYVVLPIVGVLLAVGLVIAGLIAATGFVGGIFVGAKNFFEVLQEAHKKLL